MRVLLFGRDGQLGRELHRLLSPFEGVVSVDKEEVNFTNLGDVSKVIQRIDPNLIINAAAYTQVDLAESESELAYQLNSLAPRMIAAEAEKIGAIFIHFSTDFVFDGEKGEPYIESDTPNPVNTYGLSKLEGETAVLDLCETSIVLRTSWLYGDRRTSFPWKVLYWAHTQKVVKVVEDQVGSPTWSRDLADTTVTLVKQLLAYEREKLTKITGIYHLAGRGSVSRFEWAKEIVAQDPEKSNQILEEIIPVKSDTFPNPAIRPRFSALECSKIENTFGIRMEPWKESLRIAMEAED